MALGRNQQLCSADWAGQTIRFAAFCWGLKCEPEFDGPKVDLPDLNSYSGLAWGQEFSNFCPKWLMGALFEALLLISTDYTGSLCYLVG